MVAKQNKGSTDPKQKSYIRTVHNFPNLISVENQNCEGGFFTPSSKDICDQEESIKDYFQSESIGLLLPLNSERERRTFPLTLNYTKNIGIAPERTAIVYSAQAASLVESLKLEQKGYLLLNEQELISLFNVQRISAHFAVDISKYKGKGRAIAMAFAYLKYCSPWPQMQELFQLDVDADLEAFRPLHYLGYVQATYPSKKRLFLLTAQNNELRDNHYLFVIRDYWRHENNLGQHYAKHFDSLVWAITGEYALQWPIIAERTPFALGYTNEIVTQLLAADLIGKDKNDPLQVSQVSNPNTKQDGGEFGRSGRCYDALMYRQLSLIPWLVIKHGKKIRDFSPDDYRTLNIQLSKITTTSILPDNDNHGSPYEVKVHSDLFIPPLSMLAEMGCLHI